MEVASADSRIEQVTVYARGARVRRVTTLGTAVRRIRLSGLPLALIDDTVRVSVDGPALATGVRAGFDPPATAETAAPEEPPDLREAKRLVALADAEIARLKMALEQLASARIVTEDSPRRLGIDEVPAPWAAIVAARRTVVGVRTARELALREAMTAARRDADQARRTLDAAMDRDRRGGTARPPKHHEARKHVEIELVSTGTGPLEIHLEYLVEAARWAPSYVARIEGSRATVEVRAVVAQDTGEDWSAVPLLLSTAEPAQFSQLPELAAQKIGRRQAEPLRGGFRAPPVGAVTLYSDYDRETVRHRPVEKPEPVTSEDTSRARIYTPTSIAMPQEMPMADKAGAAFAKQVWDEESSAAKERFSTPPRGNAIPESAPMMMQAAYSADLDDGVRFRGPAPPAKHAGAPAMPPRQKPVPAPTTVPRLDYGNLMMAPPSSPLRGRLIAAPTPTAPTTRAPQIDALALPNGCHADWSHAYDYAYSTDGAVDVRADGAWHSIAVTSRGAQVELRHVAVPREQADVFRVATIVNPFLGPLLPGPIDVYDRGRFLVTSPVEHAPPGARLEIGLGVDAAVKIARNCEFREEATGMLRGALRLHHTVAIDVENASGAPIDLEVRERIPVTPEGDDDIEVTLGKVDPAWERWTPDADAPVAIRLRGGHRWRLAVPAGQKRTFRVAYEVKIPSKAELVGGNRRES